MRPDGRSFGDRLASRFAAAIGLLLLCLFVFGQGSAHAEVRALKVYDIHTKERATIVFKRNGVYDPAGLAQLNRFLRDWRQDKPTKMDPGLIDLAWQVYQHSGSSDYIHVVCGYRSPETNGMLRRRSKGVAQNSLHMSGKAMDFYLPGVNLAKLREISLKMQDGGVGFYPTSGSPFIHIDTGSVRHWPRMSREQLVKVFPSGNTLHIPSDGKPLPGYSQALAAYQARKAGGGTAVARLGSPSRPALDAPEPQVIAVAADPDQAEDDIIASTPLPAPRRAVGVAVANYSTAATPMPRLAPRHPRPSVIAAVDVDAPVPTHTPDFDIVAAASPILITPGIDFGSPQDWTGPAVPSALATAMAERDRLRSGASLPIPPTAVVATIDVSRPLRAAAITTAVLRSSEGSLPAVPEVLAYAPLDAFRSNPPRQADLTSAGVPLPQPSPRRIATISRPPPATRSIIPEPRMQAPALLMTALDTQGLRLWIGPGSTRQKSYALLTMPDFNRVPGLTGKPEITFGAGFGRTAYDGLRTDHFAGPLVVQPAMVELTAATIVAAAR